MNVRRGPGAFAEINVTPMVDVMLVLLIIFMVAAPLLDQGIDVVLPPATTGQQVCLGLIVTRDRMPLGYGMFPGNRPT